jgi:hypothetical protein
MPDACGSVREMESPAICHRARRRRARGRGVTDLRQGVTPTQHAVLDLIEERSKLWSDLDDFQGRLRMAHARAGSAMRASEPQAKRFYAMEAAARLIDAAEEIGRLIDAGDA